MLQVPRRSVLLAPVALAAAAATAACTDTAPPPPPTDPDRVALEAAQTIEAELLGLAGRWSVAATGATRLATQVTDVLEAHLATLATTLGSTPVGTPSASTTSAEPELVTSSTLAIAAARAAHAHTTSLRSTGGQAAQLLASIAASDSAIADALRKSS
jgi:hypothetical protein